MRPILLLPAFVLATPAGAHTGHLGELGGHDHWTLGVGLGVIVGAAVIGWIKGGRAEEKAPEAGEEEDAAPEDGERST